MTNRLRSEIEEEEIIEPEPVKQEIPAPSSGSFISFLSKGSISKEAATEALPFIIFLAFLGMMYIGNRHSAENNIRKIDKLSKEVKELSWDFKTLKADLMFKSKQTEVIKRVDSVLGLRVSIKPPIKIKVVNNEH
jgi:Bacteriodetes cell division protein (FtsL-like)